MGAAEFYDDYLSYHIRSGINDRIYGLYKRLRKAGLRTDDAVLEIGCGIGALTYLLSRKIKKGVIEAFDISPKSIDFATRNIRQANVRFSVADILHYESGEKSFDTVLLFDVLEHVPLDAHPQVLKRIAQWLKPGGNFFINLPSPEYLLYYQQNHPEELQELDQAIFLNNILPQLEEAGWELVLYEMYSVWLKDDYRFLHLRKKQAIVEEMLHPTYSIRQKSTNRMRHAWRKLLYRYPPKLT